MMTLPTWLVELINKIDQSDDFVCKHIEDYLDGRIDNLGVARLFDLVGCLIDKVEDTQTLLNKALDRVAQSSVELATENVRLQDKETDIKQIQDCLTEIQCRIVTKENELSMADAEIDRLRDQLHRLFGEIDRLKEQNQLLQAERDELVRHEERRINELQTMLNGYTAMEKSMKQDATLKQRGET